MAKTPKSSMDEEDIIRRRDGVASDHPLAPEDRRALADARLRALAFALSAEHSAPAGDRELSDTDLLAYLLDALPPERLQQVEAAIRRDKHVLTRLMTLRSALDEQPDERDRRRANDPARAIRRHFAGEIEIRTAGELLQFKEVPVSPQLPQKEHGADFVAVAAHKEAFSRPFSELRALREVRQSDRETEARLRSVLERAKSHFDAGRHLVHEMQVLLGRQQHADLREAFRVTGRDPSPSGDIKRLWEQLAELLHQFQIIAKTTSVIMDRLEIVPRTEPTFSPPNILSHAVAADDELSIDHETWVDAIGVEAGPWRVNLSGSVFPAPRLAITISEKIHEITRSDVFLTLVRPRHGFETATIDSAGRASFPLPPGESVLLVQDDEVREIRLSFQNGSGSSRSRQFFEE